jgi:L-ascorbate metabolism protein UlaG (beta-lactamase superfamily)
MQIGGVYLRRVEITWLAHAAFKIRSGSRIIYIDPRYMKTHARIIGTFFENPEEADIILFTHDHADHFHPSSIGKMITSHTTLLGPERCRKKMGSRVRAIAPGEHVTVGTIDIETTEAYSNVHFRKPGVPWHPRGEGVGYIITLWGKRVYHAGDTDFIPEMKKLRGIDIAMLPIDGKFNMGINDASKAVMAIKPRIAIPMHSLHADPYEFKKKVEAKSYVEVVVPKIGEVCVAV